MKYRHIFTILLAAALTFTLAACGDAEGEGAGEVVEITVEPDGNEMLFQQESLTVEAGQEVRLVFDNTATAPSMAHNWVLLDTDDDDEASRVGEAAFAAGSNNEYIPDDPLILAYTPVAQIGETVEVTFTAPEEPGEYIYFCTYPGHHQMMRGVLTVTG